MFLWQVSSSKDWLWTICSHFTCPLSQECLSWALEVMIETFLEFWMEINCCRIRKSMTWLIGCTLAKEKLGQVNFNQSNFTLMEYKTLKWIHHKLLCLIVDQPLSKCQLSLMKPLWTILKANTFHATRVMVGFWKVNHKFSVSVGTVIFLPFLCWLFK